MSRRVTIRDVAERAGVTPSVVSEVLRNHPRARASEETRRRIADAAAALAYAPNVVAQQLRTGRTAVVGILFHRLAAFRVYAPVLTGIESVLRPAGLTLQVSSTDGPEEERQALRLLRSQQAAGVIVVSTLAQMAAGHLIEAAQDGLPLVAVNRWLETDGEGVTPVPGPVPRVMWDNAGGASALVTHLLALGHRRLAVVSNLSWPLGTGSLGHLARWQASCRVATAAGCPQPAQLTLDQIRDGSWRRLGATALMGLTDLTAADTLHALSAQGVAVPRDVSLTGFTNTDTAAHLTPRLTTAELPFEASGRWAAATIHRLLRGEAVAPLQVAPCPLIARESTGPVAKPVAERQVSDRTGHEEGVTA